MFWDRDKNRATEKFSLVSCTTRLLRFKKSQELFALKRQLWLQEWSFLNSCEQVKILFLTFHDIRRPRSAGRIFLKFGDESLSTFCFPFPQNMVDIITGICCKVFLKKGGEGLSWSLSDKSTCHCRRHVGLIPGLRRSLRRSHMPRTTNGMCHNYWACALEPTWRNYWSPHALVPVLHSKRTCLNEKPPYCKEEEPPLMVTWKSPCAAPKTQHSQKEIKLLKKKKGGETKTDMIGYHLYVESNDTKELIYKIEIDSDKKMNWWSPKGKVGS